MILAHRRKKRCQLPKGLWVPMIFQWTPKVKKSRSRTAPLSQTLTIPLSPPMWLSVLTTTKPGAKKISGQHDFKLPGRGDGCHLGGTIISGSLKAAHRIPEKNQSRRCRGRRTSARRLNACWFAMHALILESPFVAGASLGLLLRGLKRRAHWSAKR